MRPGIAVAPTWFRFARWMLAALVLLPNLRTVDGLAQEVPELNPFRVMSGEWDVMSRAWIGPEAPQVQLLRVTAALSEEGPRLEVVATDPQGDLWVRRVWVFSPEEGTVRGFSEGRQGVRSEVSGQFDEATRTLTIHGTNLHPGGIRFGYRDVWELVSENELRFTEYLIGSGGQESGRFSEAVYLRRN